MVLNTKTNAEKVPRYCIFLFSSLVLQSADSRYQLGVQDALKAGNSRIFVKPEKVLRCYPPNLWCSPKKYASTTTSTLLIVFSIKSERTMEIHHYWSRVCDVIQVSTMIKMGSTEEKKTNKINGPRETRCFISLCQYGGELEQNQRGCLQTPDGVFWIFKK